MIWYFGQENIRKFQDIWNSARPHRFYGSQMLNWNPYEIIENTYQLVFTWGENTSVASWDVTSSFLLATDFLNQKQIGSS